MTEEKVEIVSLSSLLKGATDTQIVELKTMEGLSVKIKKANAGVLSNVMKVSGDNVLEQFIWLVVGCVVEPKISERDARLLNHAVLIEIGTAIARFSGLDRDSVEGVRNLLEIE